MGMHVMAVAVKGKMALEPVALLAALGFSGAEETTRQGEDSFFSPPEESGCLRVYLMDGWSFVSGDLYPPMHKVLKLNKDSNQYRTLDFLHERLGRVSAESAALCFVAESSSGTFGFDWFESGILRRTFWEIEGVTIRDEGEPLFEGEGQLLAQVKEDEMALFPLIERLTVDFDNLTASVPRYFRFQSADCPRKKPFWQFW